MLLCKHQTPCAAIATPHTYTFRSKDEEACGQSELIAKATTIYTMLIERQGLKRPEGTRNKKEIPLADDDNTRVVQVGCDIPNEVR